MSLLPVNSQLFTLDKPLDIIILCGFFWGSKNNGGIRTGLFSSNRHLMDRVDQVDKMDNILYLPAKLSIGSIGSTRSVKSSFLMCSL